MHFQVVSDLNGVVGEAVGFSGRELTQARWQVGLRAIDGASSLENVGSLGHALWGRSSHPRVHLRQSISLPGVRAIDLSRESAVTTWLVVRVAHYVARGEGAPAFTAWPVSSSVSGRAAQLVNTNNLRRGYAVNYQLLIWTGRDGCQRPRSSRSGRRRRIIYVSR